MSRPGFPTNPDPSISAVSPHLRWPWQPVSSRDLYLVQVHYYIRHGERTPVRSRMTDIIPSRWDLCHVGKEFKASVLGSNGDREQMAFYKGVEGVERNRRAQELDGECLMGELTDLGRLSTLTLGQHLRSIYVEKYGLLAAGQRDSLYVRSTNMSRTIETAQQVLRGLLGSDGAGLTPKILVRNGPSENLLPNTYSCPTLYKLDSQFSRTVASLLNPSLQQYDPVLSPHLAGVGPRVDGHPRLSGILDTVRAATAHGFPVPKVFSEQEMLRSLEHAVCSEWFYGYTAPDAEERATYRRLAMGPLLSDLSERLVNKAKVAQADPLQMAIYATHDTTLAGFLSTLGCFPNRWPAFTASIGVELYRGQEQQSDSSTLASRILGRSSNRQQHYLRFLYNGLPVNVPACAATGKHKDGDESLCTLEAFVEAVEGLKRKDGMGWDEECALGRGERSSK